jgi:hypothetical protein
LRGKLFFILCEVSNIASQYDFLWCSLLPSFFLSQYLLFKSLTFLTSKTNEQTNEQTNNDRSKTFCGKVFWCSAHSVLYFEKKKKTFWFCWIDPLLASWLTTKYGSANITFAGFKLTIWFS